MPVKQCPLLLTISEVWNHLVVMPCKQKGREILENCESFLPNSVELLCYTLTLFIPGGVFQLQAS